SRTEQPSLRGATCPAVAQRAKAKATKVEAAKMDCFRLRQSFGGQVASLAMTISRSSHRDNVDVCNDSTIAPRGAPATGRDRTPVRLQAVPDRDVPRARHRAVDGIPHLSAWHR